MAKQTYITQSNLGFPVEIKYRKRRNKEGYHFYLNSAYMGFHGVAVTQFKPITESTSIFDILNNPNPITIDIKMPKVKKMKNPLL